MDYITTTQLRTKSADLVESLRYGKSINLIHRSKVIGRIKPIEATSKKFEAKKFKEIVDKLNLPYLTDQEKERKYRAAMMKKHGKYLL